MTASSLEEQQEIADETRQLREQLNQQQADAGEPLEQAAQESEQSGGP